MARTRSTTAADAVDLLDPRGRIEFDDVTFRVPRCQRGLPRLARGRRQRGARRPRRGRGPPRHHGDRRARPARCPRRAVGCGQDHAQLARPPALRRHRGRRAHRRSRRAPVTHDSACAPAIGVVSQDPHLFHDTVGANLRYARPDVTDDEIVEACRAAQIHDVIAALPDGYDTVVGERGLPPVGRREAAPGHRPHAAQGPGHRDPRRGHQPPRLRERGRSSSRPWPTALRGRTALVIAHRLSTIVSADQILVLDDGHSSSGARHDGSPGRRRPLRRALPHPRAR